MNDNKNSDNARKNNCGVNNNNCSNNDNNNNNNRRDNNSNNNVLKNLFSRKFCLIKLKQGSSTQTYLKTSYKSRKKFTKAFLSIN